MGINERLTNSLTEASSEEFAQRLNTALEISRESCRSQSGIKGKIRWAVQEPAIGVTLLAMRVAQSFGCGWITNAPLEAEIASFEGRSQWKSSLPTLKLEAIRHGVTIPLTLVSTSALEAVSIASGTFLAGVNPFSEADPRLAIGALLLSYGFWFSGMAVNARQAWNMLEETGVSVSWWAKVGHDASKKLTDSQTIQKAASYTGFTAMELAKEIPWWLGAFGGKFAISQAAPEYNTHNMEFSFLMGANVGATFYNYFQAGGVEGILRAVRYIRKK